MRWETWACGFALLSLAGSGCYGGRSDDVAGSATTGDGGSAGEDSEEPLVEGCGGPEVGVAGVRRLTREQYDNTIRDLLGDDTRPASNAFRPDTPAGGFAANVDTFVDALQLEDYLIVAEDVAQRAVSSKLDAWLDCSVEDTSCVEPLLRDLASRAFRRPVSDSELTDLVGLYEATRTTWGGQEGLTLAIQAMLGSPHFLYLVELEPAGDEVEVVPLGDYELATRLSYFMWNTMPDDALFAAAAAGELGTREGVEAQARRMLLETDKLVATLESFHVQWLGLDEGLPDEKDPDVFPTFTTELAASMRAEALAFVRHVFTNDEGRLDALLTASYGFADAQLAPVFGIDPPAGEGLVQVELDPERYAGILTRPRFLAAHAHQADVSWVQRGLFVRRNLLCQILPDPPADAMFDAPLDPNRVDDPACAGCHALIDPIGQGFDNYDAIGRFRTEYADGSPVQSDGVAVNAGAEGDIEFSGAVELAHALADNEAVKACVARNWLRYAVARVEGEADACSTSYIESKLAESSGDLRELLVAIAVSDSFRYRRKTL